MEILRALQFGRMPSSIIFINKMRKSFLTVIISYFYSVPAKYSKTVIKHPTPLFIIYTIHVSTPPLKHCTQRGRYPPSPRHPKRTVFLPAR